MRPAGNWPQHWTDKVHEDDGGCNRQELRPQDGREVCAKEVYAIGVHAGTAWAQDVATAKALDCKLVKQARMEEVA